MSVRCRSCQASERRSAPAPLLYRPFASMLCMSTTHLHLRPSSFAPAAMFADSVCSARLKPNAEVLKIATYVDSGMELGNAATLQQSTASAASGPNGGMKSISTTS
jgi:hypothetical protein